MPSLGPSTCLLFPSKLWLMPSTFFLACEHQPNYVNRLDQQQSSIISAQADNPGGEADETIHSSLESWPVLQKMSDGGGQDKRELGLQLELHAY